MNPTRAAHDVEPARLRQTAVGEFSALNAAEQSRLRLSDRERYNRLRSAWRSQKLTLEKALAYASTRPEREQTSDALRHFLRCPAFLGPGTSAE